MGPSLSGSGIAMRPGDEYEDHSLLTSQASSNGTCGLWKAWKRCFFKPRSQRACGFSRPAGSAPTASPPVRWQLCFKTLHAVSFKECYIAREFARGTKVSKYSNIVLIGGQRNVQLFWA
jgi:hypothetical protein